jgi:hypothetical protein
MMLHTKGCCFFAVAFFWIAPAVASAADAPQAAAPISNAEMKAIFDADQGERKAGPIDWKALAAADETRRARTRELLAAGKLNTADDFWEAAFVFQHGETADSYLLAHILAMVSVAKGKPEAIWISAVTLDRYLLTIGQKQVLGTQYSRPDPKGIWTQEPYDRKLISDALRQQLKVGTLAQQDATLKQFQDRKD